MHGGEELISEPIQPDAGTFDTAAMARGQPGLPDGFTWRDQHYRIEQLLDSWKQSESSTHRPGGERYYRKHFFRILTDTGERMTLYALRHVKQGESAKRRWWLYTVDHPQR